MKKYLVATDDRGLGSGRAAKLCFNHREGGLDVRPLAPVVKNSLWQKFGRSHAPFFVIVASTGESAIPKTPPFLVKTDMAQPNTDKALIAEEHAEETNSFV